MTISLLLGTLLAQAAAAPPETAAGGQWTFYGREEGLDYFLDGGSPPDSNGIVSYRVRGVVRTAGSAPYHSVIATFLVDCRRQTSALSAIATYDSAGRIDRSDTIPPEGRDIVPVYSGTEEEKLYLRFCPASLRKPVPAAPPPPRIVAVTPLPTPPPILAPPAPPPPPPVPPSPPPPPEHHPAVPARAVAPLATLFTADDYPAAALIRAEQGTVAFRLSVDRDGYVTRCAVTSSSGSISLDSVTCRLVTARARFIPARDAKGKRTEDIVRGRISWRIPEDEPPPATSPPAQ